MLLLILKQTSNAESVVPIVVIGGIDVATIEVEVTGVISIRV